MDLPQSLAWLWRYYDPAKTELTYEIEETEGEKALFRVTITNREAWQADTEKVRLFGSHADDSIRRSPPGRPSFSRLPRSHS